MLLCKKGGIAVNEIGQEVIHKTLGKGTICEKIVKGNATYIKISFSTAKNNLYFLMYLKIL